MVLFDTTQSEVPGFVHLALGDLHEASIRER